MTVAGEVSLVLYDTIRSVLTGWWLWQSVTVSTTQHV